MSNPLKNIGHAVLHISIVVGIGVVWCHLVVPTADLGWFMVGAFAVEVYRRIRAEAA